MNGSLKILDYYDEMNFMKSKVFGNWWYSTMWNACAWKKLRPFFYDKVPHYPSPNSITVSTFSLREIKITGYDYEVQNTYSINTSLINWNRGTILDTLYYTGIDTQTLTNATTGLYQFYIVLSDNTVLVSEPFWIIINITSYPDTPSNGDFNTTDFGKKEYFI